jgi:hypothetical protein
MRICSLLIGTDISQEPLGLAYISPIVSVLAPVLSHPFLSSILHPDLRLILLQMEEQVNMKCWYLSTKEHHC